MTPEEIQQILDAKAVPFPTEELALVETHISWVLLADTHVYKFKKPLKFSFLDFSTPEKRRSTCQQEVALNRRLAPGMYLGVLPVRSDNGRFRIDGTPGQVVDYVVLMRRMDERRQMDVLMEQGEVHPEDVERIAVVLAQFHKSAQRIPGGTSFGELLEEFMDIKSVIPFVENNLGKKEALLMEAVNGWVPGFLRRVQSRVEERDRLGYVIDGHGDLHCRNIFLGDPPVIFDCIEFNADLRSLDMLNEIAFLCMDLERYGRPDLARVFLGRYLADNPVMEGEADRKLFLFYKMYRANVRMKVTCIHQMEATGTAREGMEERDLIRQYLELYERYFRELKRLET